MSDHKRRTPCCPSEAVRYLVADATPWALTDDERRALQPVVALEAEPPVTVLDVDEPLAVLLRAVYEDRYPNATAADWRSDAEWIAARLTSEPR